MDHDYQQSIARAHADMLAERRRIEAAIPGIQITDDGTFLRPRLVGKVCHQCWFVAFRATAAEAQRTVATHQALRHGLSLVKGRAS